MCGICGIARSDEQAVDLERLLSMRDLLSHRGPDAAGHWSTPGIAFGHRRLSIIDLSGGAQPLSNEDGTVWVTFNGEIYNFPELREQLLARGHQFRTHSDTEVLVHGYEEFGLDLPGKLNGIFAFGIYDIPRKRLLLARDQLGVKPLFYGIEQGILAFASEVKSVLHALDLAPRMSKDALQEYLMFRYVTHDRSFFEGVRRLPPGHVLLWEGGRADIRRYWSLPAAPSRRGEISLSEGVEELDVRLGTAVQRQMMSDVPLGAFCSGGVDSGVTTGYASGSSPHRLHTFSVGFSESAWDESELAKDTAGRFGTDHHVVTADPSRIKALLKELIWFNDEPLSHPNSVPLYELSREARKFVTVVLTGEGADEIFSGYPRHHIARARFAADRLPTFLRRAVAGLLRLLPGHKAAKLGSLLPYSLEDSLIFNSVYVAPEVVSGLTKAPVSKALETRRALVREALVPGDAVASIARYETLTYLVCALDRMDRMSMAVGLEARVPFLDMELVEWGLGISSRLKASGRESKRVLKRLAKRMLSDRITAGRKSGFGLPLDEWFRSPEYASLMDLIADPEHPAAQHFDRAMLDRIVAEHLERRADHGELLWVLANVYLWHEVHLPRVAESLEPSEMVAGVA